MKHPAGGILPPGVIAHILSLCDTIYYPVYSLVHTSWWKWLVPIQTFAKFNHNTSQAEKLVRRVSITDGNVPLMRWLVSQGTPLYYHALHHAIEDCGLDMVKVLRGAGRMPLCGYCTEVAIDEQKWGILEWLLEQDCPFGSNSMAYILRHDHIERLPHLLALGMPWDAKAWVETIKFGGDHCMATLTRLEELGNCASMSDKQFFIMIISEIWNGTPMTFNYGSKYTFYKLLNLLNYTRYKEKYTRNG